MISSVIGKPFWYYKRYIISKRYKPVVEVIHGVVGEVAAEVGLYDEAEEYKPNAK